MDWGPWNGSSGFGSDAKWGCHTCPWVFWVNTAARHCPAVTSPGTAAVSKDTGGPGSTAAPEGQAETPLPPGHCSKRGLLEPTSVPQESSCNLPDPQLCGPPERHGHCPQPSPAWLPPLLPAHSAPGLLQTLNSLGQTAPAPLEQHKAAAVLPCQGSKHASGMTQTSLYALLFERNP